MPPHRCAWSRRRRALGPASDPGRAPVTDRGWAHGPRWPRGGPGRARGAASWRAGRVVKGHPVRWGVLALAVVLPAVLVYVASPRHERVLMVEPGVQALVIGKSWGFGGARNTALYTGELVVIEQGCLGFDYGVEQSAVVFPTGTTVLPGGGGVRTPQGLAVRIGDEITAGGGGRGLEASDNWVLEFWPAAASTCAMADSTASLYDITLVEAN